MSSHLTPYLVRRYRAGEGAPSLSLGYSAYSAAEALIAHFRRYPGGVADDTTYVVIRREDHSREAFNAREARTAVREARRLNELGR